MFLDDRGGVRDGVGTRQLLFVVFSFSVLRWWGGGGGGGRGWNYRTHTGSNT